ncbi:MAG: universal stress protein [Gammaproteobacteria bacterium]|jgi:nucleotide-binding universal stress UspA family protein
MKRFKNILYFADGAVDTTTALDRAVNLARSNHARLTVLDVLAESDSPAEIEKRFGTDLNGILRERRHEMLKALVAPFNEADAVIYTRVLTGNPFVEAIRAVLRNGYDLVIKAARPPEGFSERMLGSADMHLLRKCPCPVWIDRPGAAFPYRTVLAAVDPVGAETRGCGQLIMDLSISLAQRESAGLAVVHAWRPFGESMLRNGRARVSAVELEGILEQTRGHHRQRLDALLSGYGLKTGDSRVHLVKGQPAPCIRALSEELQADLIVMGTVGRVGIPGVFIGNTAEEVLQTTRASILAVKPEGFVSPVTLPPGG